MHTLPGGKLLAAAAEVGARIDTTMGKAATAPRLFSNCRRSRTGTLL
jgi:hypothetical protein